MKAAPHVLNYGWNMVSKTKPVKYLLQKMRDTLGIDLNDDDGGYNKFTYDASLGKNMLWSDLDN